METNDDLVINEVISKFEGKEIIFNLDNETHGNSKEYSWDGKDFDKTVINPTSGLNGYQRDMLEDSIYLKMMISVIQRNKEQALSNFKLAEPFADYYESVLKQLRLELGEINKHLKKEKIRYEVIKKDDLFTDYLFVAKGRSSKHNYFNFHMKNQVQKRLDKYLNAK